MGLEFSWLFTITTLTILCFITVPVHSQCLEGQESLLLELKNSLQFNPDSSVKLVSWTRSNDCCQWNGVTCDHFGHVVGLDLAMESIFGGLNHSSSLFGLKYLEKLNLAFNRFNSILIPSNFGILTSLTYLNLSNTGFVGQIPIAFSQLTRLVTLDLSSFWGGYRNPGSLKIESPNLSTLFVNHSGFVKLYLDGVNISLNGYEWGQAISSSMPKLRVLSLSNCYLSGPIDFSLQKLKNLCEVNLGSNNIASPVPDFIANFPNLKVLILSNSNLIGKFPVNILGQLQTLETLNLASNPLLNGSLPESIGNLKELRWVDIWGCNFSGPIPDSLANLSELVYLDFSSNNFSGPIPSFKESKNLTYIYLSHNSFTGSIPSSLFFLPSLQKLVLSNNRFGGQISGFPHKGSLSNLETLDLSSNLLEGPIPSYFFDFLRLKVLSLSFNNFTRTVDLKTIQGLQNLSRLELSYNNLTVDASVDISILPSFPRLTILSLASCNLQKFPALMNQSGITYLDISHNKISGIIPTWIWNVGDQSLRYSLGHLNLSCNLLVGLESGYIMPSLSVLDLHSNMLVGEIPLPPETAVYVDYSSNNFTTSIPDEIGNGLSSANFFSLANNALTGPIPPSICNGSRPLVLDLSNNMLSGTIPHCLIENCTETLGVLNLGNNNLSGSVTGTFPRGCVLETLDLSGNHFEGNVPESLSNCTMLEVLNLGRNNLSDNFPCFLKNSSDLSVLVLRSNAFQGGIHCPRVNNSSQWPKLQIIDISLNNFSGHMPPKFFLHWNAMMIDNTKRHPKLLRYELLNLYNFYYQDKVTVTMKGIDIELVKILTLCTVIDFSGNSFEGEIPETIGPLSSIHVLNLSRNALSGQIPSNFGNLTQIESLDLSLNKLNGSIPPTLARLTFLAVLDLSYNQLVGMIPRGNQFNTFSNDSFEGNVGLCGPPLSNTCNYTPVIPPVTSPMPRVKDSCSASKINIGQFICADEEEINWFFIAATLGYTVGFGVIVGPLLYSKRWRQCYYRPLDRVIVRILHQREQRSKQQRRRNNIKKLRKSQHH